MKTNIRLTCLVGITLIFSSIKCGFSPCISEAYEMVGDFVYGAARGTTNDPSVLTTDCAI
jgi:hypothetical protein